MYFETQTAGLFKACVCTGDMSVASASSPDESPSYKPEQLRYGAHMIQLDRSIHRISGIAIRHMGQGGRLARYPLHAHFVGEFGVGTAW
jgi:hypothetical protein